MSVFNPNMGHIKPPKTNMTRAKKLDKKYKKYDAKFKKFSKRTIHLEKRQKKLVDQYKADVLKANTEALKAHPQYKYVQKKMQDKKGKTATRTERVKVQETPHGPTSDQLKLFMQEKHKNLYGALQVARKRRNKARKLSKKYRPGQHDVIANHRYRSLKAAKHHMGPNNGMDSGNYNDGTNSWIVPNDAQSDDDYVAMQVTEESDDHSTDAASTPVEHGTNIVTTTQMQAPQISITAKVSGGPIGNELPDSDSFSENEDMHAVKQKINRLQHWSHAGSDMYWEGPHEYAHVIITDISTTYNWGPDGSLTTADISMTLTVADYFDSTKKGKKGSKKHMLAHARARGLNSKRKNTKHFVTAKSGMTYAYIAAKKGVSVQSLEEKNSYKATKIPIGGKIYY